MNDTELVLMQEASDLHRRTLQGDITWKQSPNQQGFVCTPYDGTNFEIVQVGEHRYVLARCDSSHKPNGVLQNDDPLPGEFQVSGRRGDANGYVEEAGALPLYALTQPLHMLILLYGAAKESANM